MAKKLDKKFYEKELARLQTELVYVQRWVKETGARIVVLFEGRDAAGKGGAIKRITELLNPRICKVVALPVPTEKEKTQWYFQRYVEHLPAAGEMVLFDRSWYNRAGVEKVMGFCTDEQYEYFMRVCPDFENMLIRDGIILIKYWFSVSEEEQRRRFEARINDPNKQWKISPMDMQSRQHWVDYSRAKDTMLRYTDTKLSPWYIVDAEDKKKSRLNCIAHLLSVIPYERIEFPKLELQPLQEDNTYIRPPMEEQTWVPDVATKRNAEYLAKQEKLEKQEKAEKAERAKEAEGEEKPEIKKKKSKKIRSKDKPLRVYEGQSFSSAENRYIQRARDVEEEEQRQSRRSYYENYVEEEEEATSKGKTRVRYADLLAKQNALRAILLDEQEEELENSIEDLAFAEDELLQEEALADELSSEDLAELEALDLAPEDMEQELEDYVELEEAGELADLEEEELEEDPEEEPEALSQVEAQKLAEEANKKSTSEAKRIAELARKETEHALAFEAEPLPSLAAAEEATPKAQAAENKALKSKDSKSTKSTAQDTPKDSPLTPVEQTLDPAKLAAMLQKQQEELAKLADLEQSYSKKIKALEQALQQKEAALAQKEAELAELGFEEEAYPEHYTKRISLTLHESKGKQQEGEEDEAQESKRKKKKRRRIYDGLEEERIFWKSSQR